MPLLWSIQVHTQELSMPKFLSSSIQVSFKNKFVDWSNHRISVRIFRNSPISVATEIFLVLNPKTQNHCFVKERSTEKKALFKVTNHLFKLKERSKKIQHFSALSPYPHLGTIVNWQMTDTSRNQTPNDFCNDAPKYRKLVDRSKKFLSVQVGGSRQSCEWPLPEAP